MMNLLGGKNGAISMSGIYDAYMLFDSQNYTPREMQIIYDKPNDVDEKEFRRLLDKAIDKYHDWRVATHILHKYDDKGNLR